jgi:hypothetical protein
MDDPQSLNLYAYVRNNPITHVDLDGHCMGWECMQVTASQGQKDQDAKAQQNAVNDAQKKLQPQQHTPLSPGQIKSGFYKQYGGAFNAAVNKVFGKDAPRQGQTLGNSPTLNISLNSEQLQAKFQKDEPLAGDNTPDFSR